MARRPIDACQATPASVPTATTAPGSSLRAMAASTTLLDLAEAGKIVASSADGGCRRPGRARGRGGGASRWLPERGWHLREQAGEKTRDGHEHARHGSELSTVTPLLRSVSLAVP